MVDNLQRKSIGIMRAGLWGALIYGVIGPTYAFSRTLISASNFVETTSFILKQKSPAAHPRSLYWLMEYTADRQEDEQATIRAFRRNIEAIVGEDCGTVDREQYELPKVEQLKRGKYELRMECKGKTLVAPFGEVELR